MRETFRRKRTAWRTRNAYICRRKEEHEVKRKKKGDCSGTYSCPRLTPTRPAACLSSHFYEHPGRYPNLNKRPGQRILQSGQIAVLLTHILAVVAKKTKFRYCWKVRRGQMTLCVVSLARHVETSTTSSSGHVLPKKMPMAAATAPARSTDPSPSRLCFTIGCTHRVSASWARTEWKENGKKGKRGRQKNCLLGQHFGGEIVKIVRFDR